MTLFETGNPCARGGAKNTEQIGANFVLATLVDRVTARTRFFINLRTSGSIALGMGG